MKILLLILSLAVANAWAGLKVMNFNVMCDVCGTPQDYGTFEQRLNAMADTINRHRPDLMSLQEFRTRAHVVRLMKKLNGSYHLIHGQITRFSYTDPVLLVRKDRFTLRRHNGFWLGPNRFIPLGWKRESIPRRIHWAQLFDRLERREFIFMGSHFDNSSANKLPSAKVANKLFNQFSLPVIFAADTNIRAFAPGYADLLGTNMLDTFPGPAGVVFHANAPFETSDACHDPGSIFPECRIEHVLLSKNSPWTAQSWALDLFRYRGRVGFLSDHRAVIVELE